MNSQSWKGILSCGNYDTDQNASLDPHYQVQTQFRFPLRNPFSFLEKIGSGFIRTSLERSFTRNSSTTTPIDRFWFPQEKFPNWNNVFAKSGFLDYQCSIPINGTSDCLEEFQSIVCSTPLNMFFVVIKVFGTADSSTILQFHQEGLSITFEMLDRPEARAVLDQLDECVIRYGGRVNLVKDARLSPRSLQMMYPKLDKWVSTKKEFDPKSTFVSDLGKRLGLLGA